MSDRSPARTRRAGVLDRSTAAAWIARWEIQQERYAVDREERFEAIDDVVELATARNPRPLVADLGCGPGSLAVRLAGRLPGARVVAADADPLLLALGRAYGLNAVEYVDAVIGEPGWVTALGLDRPLDAVVSSAALHYPQAEALGAIYRDLSDALRPGGVLVNGDHMEPGDPAMAAFARAVGRRRAERRAEVEGEDWQSWWDAAAREPAFAELLAERAERPALADGGDNLLSAADHERLLRAAGFRSVGVVWRCGPSCVQVAVR
ncbi:class I SAM-dependent methyltransferase [Kitasatospora sp. NPDC057904]|uniref:class I SAM-dependent methyltransferase n=1 Tax=unclassified Kitasatospora TaxID=2633591 RepID=UPI0036DA41FD